MSGNHRFAYSASLPLRLKQFTSFCGVISRTQRYSSSRQSQRFLFRKIELAALQTEKRTSTSFSLRIGTFFSVSPILVRCNGSTPFTASREISALHFGVVSRRLSWHKPTVLKSIPVHAQSMPVESCNPALLWIAARSGANCFTSAGCRGEHRMPSISARLKTKR